MGKVANPQDLLIWHKQAARRYETEQLAQGKRHLVVGVVRGQHVAPEKRRGNRGVSHVTYILLIWRKQAVRRYEGQDR